MVGFVAVLAAFLAGGAAESRTAFAPLDDDERQLVADRARRALQVDGRACGGAISGSGFVVDDRVVTNGHLVEGADSVSLRSALLARPLEVVIERRSAELDLAVMGPVSLDGLVLADVDPPVGQPVVIVGWVSGELRMRPATVHLYVDGSAYGGHGPTILLDPATTFGFSGGPVLDRTGQVVAISRAVDLATGLTVAVPASALGEWLDDGLHGDTKTSCRDE